MIRIPRSQVLAFHKAHPQPSQEGQRYGQAFYTFAELDKVENPGDKLWCNELYYAGSERARRMVIERTDWEN